MFVFSVLGGLAIMAAFAAGFVAATWRVASRFGARWLPVAWLVGTATFWVVSFLRLSAQGMAIHVPPQSAAEEVALLGFGSFGVIGVGMATLSVRRRLRRSADGRLTLTSTAAGVGAFFVGMLLALLIVAITDLWTVVARMWR